MWNERRPQRLHKVCDLLWRLPNDGVPSIRGVSITGFNHFLLGKRADGYLVVWLDVVVVEIFGSYSGWNNAVWSLIMVMRQSCWCLISFTSLSQLCSLRLCENISCPCWSIRVYNPNLTKSIIQRDERSLNVMIPMSASIPDLLDIYVLPILSCNYCDVGENLVC